LQVGQFSLFCNVPQQSGALAGAADGAAVSAAASGMVAPFSCGSVGSSVLQNDRKQQGESHCATMEEGED